jgi:fatty acid amide hydrolase
VLQHPAGLENLQLGAGDPCRLSASELHRAFRRGDFSAVEILDAFRRRNEEYRELNSLVFACWDEAEKQAQQLDERRARGESLGELAGVPLTVKDCFALRGTPSTMGLRYRAGIRDQHDAPLVAALRGADALLIGKSNVPQLMILHETDNPLYGKSLHPLDPLRSPGGSSGGEAALISAYCSAGGLGTDLGGSIRFPAHSCGIAGLKPTGRRLNAGGMFGNFSGQHELRVVPGPMARRVEDLDLLMRVWLGNGSERAMDQPPVPWSDYREVSLKGKRIAWWTEAEDFQVAPAIRRAVEIARDSLREAGAELIPWQPPRLNEVLDLYFSLLSADGGAGFRMLLRDEQIDYRVHKLIHFARLSFPFRWLATLWQREFQSPRLGRILAAAGPRSGRSLWALQAKTLKYRHDFWSQFTTQRFDALLFPPHALPAFTHGASEYLAFAGGSCYLANLLDWPAGVVPVTKVQLGEETDRKASDLLDAQARHVEQGSAGLPVGVQVCTPPYKEHLTLAIMAAVERANP